MTTTIDMDDTVIVAVSYCDDSLEYEVVHCIVVGETSLGDTPASEAVGASQSRMNWGLTNWRCAKMQFPICGSHEPSICTCSFCDRKHKPKLDTAIPLTGNLNPSFWPQLLPAF